MNIALLKRLSGLSISREPPQYRRQIIERRKNNQRCFGIQVKSEIERKREIEIEIESGDSHLYAGG